MAFRDNTQERLTAPEGMAARSVEERKLLEAKIRNTKLKLELMED